MRWFESDQSAMMAAIDRGPAYLPADLFAGSSERVLAGMKVHANTISHARLVALEETYPRTREAIGHERFNAHSRLFVEQPNVTARALADIGAGFDAFLADQGEGRGVADLARFEWLWLAAYHSADAAPLELGALAGLAPEALLEQVLVKHPAAFAGRFDRLVHDLIGKEVPELGAADSIVIARPDVDVLVSPGTNLMADVLSAASNPIMVGNLLVCCSEAPDGQAIAVDAVMRSLVALINAGALTAA